MNEYHERVGMLLIKRRIITEKQLEQALRVKEQRPYFRLGEILLGLGHLSLDALGDALEFQYHSLRLGQLLIRRNALTEEQLELALAKQADTGLRLGDQLIRMGYCTSEVIEETLEYQRTHRFFRIASVSAPQPQG